LDTEQAGQVTWFAMSLVFEEYSMDALQYATGMKVYQVIEGQSETSGEKEIGDVVFETKRTGDSKETLEFTAEYKK
jgi:hypothetical protein